MEYIPLFLFAWFLASLPAIIVTAVANRRRRDEIAELTNQLSDVTRQLDNLEHRVHAAAAQAMPPQVVPAQTAPKPAASPTQAPAISISPQEVRPVVAPAAPPVAAREAGIPDKPKAPVPAPIPQPSPTVAPPAVPPIAASVTSPTPATPKPGEKITAPPAQTLPKPIEIPDATPSSVVIPAVPVKPKPADEPSTAVPPPPPLVVPVPKQPQVAAMESSSASVRASAGSAGFNTVRSAYDKPPAKERSVSLEELVGTNWLPKLGIAIVVIGVGFLVAAKVDSMPHWLRVVMLYLSGFALLAGGIFAERKERYKTFGRALIGGGWAVTALVTYGLTHAPFMAILSSNAIDLMLLVAVISAMVWHTLKYDSQLVTGASFLLGFTAITLNPDPPYNLLAGLLLVAGMTIIVLRRHWFELEVFGILASYLNHFYWLYNIFGFEARHVDFAYHTASMALVVAYWVVFRLSYVWRKVTNKDEESVSTIAGLLNPLLFLGVMKYQSFHPEWAFYALLAFGAVEFALGQLPVSRRRRAPFLVLSSLGAALMVAAVPFKYSGGALEMLWLAGAEAFLLVGVFTRERLFRGFGLIISGLIVIYTLPTRIVPLLQEFMNGQAHYHPQLGIILAAITAVLYFNSHIIGRRWKELFADEQESQSLTGLSFAASFFAVFALCALVDDSVIGLALAMLVFVLSFLGRRFSINALVYQAHWIAAVAVLHFINSAKGLQHNSYLVFSHLAIPELVLAFVPAAALLYASSRQVRLSETGNKTLFAGAYSWAATALLAILVWYQVPAQWIAVGWIALALSLAVSARFLKVKALLWQTHVLSLLAAGWILYENFSPQYRATRVQLISVAVTVGVLYLLSWIANIAELIGDARIAQAYTWAGTGLLAALIWYQTPAQWVSVGWIALALLLTVAARLLSRVLKMRGLVWQTHILSLLAAGWTIYSSFTPEYNGTRIQLIAVAITAAVLYALSRLTQIKEIAGNEQSSFLVTGGYTWAASVLLAILIRYQAPEPWIAVGWISLALLLSLAARFWKDSTLLWQTHVLSLLATGWTLYASFAPQYRGTRVQLISVALTASLLYLLNWITNVAEIFATETPGDQRILPAYSQTYSQTYSWAGSLLVSWLIWYQFPAIDVSLAWGLLGLALFMVGDWKSWSFLRAQSYVALLCSFAHIFYANFNVMGEPGAARPEIVTVVPLVGVYFFTYWQLLGKKAQASRLEGKIHVEHLLAFLGTATLAALARFELPPETVAVAYAALVIGTLLAVWLTRLNVFLYQALILLGMTAFRISMYNFYNFHELYRSNFLSAILTIVLLAVAVPICFPIRKNARETSIGSRWLATLMGRPEQPMFFVPFILMAVLLALKVSPGMITLAWGAEAVVVFVLALWAKERSYRLSGLALLLLSAAKIVLWDVWQLNDVTARYLTLIGVGLFILAVSYLISRNREALREYL